MARFGRTTTQTYARYGIPPTETPAAAPATAPVANGFGVTGGGRHGRGTPAGPRFAYAPRPLFVSGITYNDAGTVTYTLTPSATESLAFAETGAITVTVTPSASEGLSFTDPRTTAYTVTPSATEGLSFADSSTAGFTITPGGADSLTFADTATVTFVLVPGGSESYTPGSAAAVVVTKTLLAINASTRTNARLADGAVTLLVVRPAPVRSVTYTMANRTLIQTTAKAATIVALAQQAKISLAVAWRALTGETNGSQ